MYSDVFDIDVILYNPFVHNESIELDLLHFYKQCLSLLHHKHPYLTTVGSTMGYSIVWNPQKRRHCNLITEGFYVRWLWGVGKCMITLNRNFTIL